MSESLEPNYDTNIYIVNYLVGTRGAMIMALLWQYLTNATSVPVFSKNGNAHNNLQKINHNWFTTVKMPKQAHYLIPRYELIKPKTSTLPFIIHGHDVPNFSRMKYLFPNVRLIVIKFDMKELPEICKLVYQKVQVDMLHTTIPEEIKVAEIQSTIDSDILNFYSNPNIPKDLSDNTLVIPFKELLSPILLDKLSKFTNMPTTDSILDFHKQYIMAQPKTVDKPAE